MTIRHHSKAQAYRLADYVRQHYEASGLGDTDFARKATQDLGFACSVHHVQQSRDIFEIKNNTTRARPAPRPDDLSAVLQLLESLTERVARLERITAPVQYSLQAEVRQ